jgi:hypothetical protein
MEIVVTLETRDQSLALSGNHDLLPVGKLLSLLGQVIELPDVVTLHVFVRPAGFTRIREKPLHNLRSIIPDRLGRVVQDYTWFSSK